MDIKNVDLLFSENPNPMWIFDPSDLSVREVNRSALDLFGYTREEMLSLTVADLHPGNDVLNIKVHLTGGRKQFDNAGVWQSRKKSGEVLFIRVLNTPVMIEGKSYRLVAAQDVTGSIELREKYRMLFENSLDGVMLTEPGGGILESNRAACEILGMTAAEISEAGRAGIVARDEKLERALKIRQETGKFSGELNYIHKSGRLIPVEVTSALFTNVDGKPRSSIIFRDITRQKENREALRLEKEFTDVTVNSLPGIFFVLNEQGELVRWNDNLLSVFDLPPEEADGKPATFFVYEDDRERVLKEIRKVFEEGQAAAELRMKTAGETISTYQFVANRVSLGGRTFIVGSAIDITRQKNLELKITSMLEREYQRRKEVELDRDKLRNIYKHTPSPKCLLEGSDFRFAIANEAYLKIVGKQDVIGKKLIDVVPEFADQGFLDILEKIYRSGESFTGRAVPVYVKNPAIGAVQEYTLNLIFQPLTDDSGSVSAIYIEGVDISEQLTNQRNLEESLKEKDVLLAEIHHRVKNNLAVVTSMMELQAIDSPDPELQRSLRTGQQRIKTIAMIHEILYQSKNLSYVDFADNIRKLIHSLQCVYDEAGRIGLEVTCDPVKLNINQAIPSALILNEIVTNSYKHAFNGTGTGKIEVSVSEKDGEVRIVAKDNGIGIPGEIEPERSPTLGMTLVNVLSRQLRADLALTRETGTRFSVTFRKNDLNGSGGNLFDHDEVVM